jgi:PAS domain S-box-containing protein/putative nucleotidyltransferase with HDIG domain
MNFPIVEAELRTELERERAHVRETRHQWVDTVDAIRDPIMVHDGEGRIVRANRAYADLAGVGFPEILGRKYWDCFPRRNGPLQGCANAACASSTGTVGEIALTGGEIYTSRVFALRDDGSGMPRVLHLFRNVTRERNEQAQLHARADRAIAHSNALNAVSSSAAVIAGDVTTVAQQITEEVSRATGVARANVWLFNDDETELTCVDHFDAPSRSHSSGLVLRQAQFENEFRALKAADYVAADDAMTDPRTAGYVEGYLKPNRISSMLDAVVAVSGKHLGLLCLEHVSRSHYWEEDEIAFVRQVAEKIAITISNRRAREAEQTARANEARYHAMVDQAAVAIIQASLDGTLMTVNAAFCSMLGYAESELLGRTFLEITHPDDRAMSMALRTSLIATSPFGSPPVEKRYIRKDGTTLWANLAVSAVRDASGQPEYFVAIVQDITERKRQERALDESGRRLALAKQSARIGIWDWDVVANKLVWDERMYQLYGIREQDFSGAYDAWQSGLHPEDRENAEAALAAALKGDREFDTEFRVIWPNGEVRHIEAHAVVQRAKDGTAKQMIGMNWDITQRRKDQEKLRVSEERFRGYFELGLIGMAITLPDKGIAEANDKLCEILGYSRDELERKDWASMTHPDDLDADVAQFTRVLAGEIDRYSLDKRFLRKDGTIVYTSMSVSCVRRPDRSVEYIMALIQDISERKRAEESLRGALIATVEAIAATVETRDPYTAGHQSRVADLATAIALEMGLSPELAQGIHFGAQIHDLGKMQVPAELLAKPTRLTKLEFELIKTHPQAGYEIVKDIKFPWRVAEIVHQHHERLDGSGYPQGLKGDAIALEARIVAVADVVEAMASHRPYRPGLGIEVALKEIQDKRGRWFHPAAVDACVRLFREKGYRLQQASA